MNARAHSLVILSTFMVACSANLASDSSRSLYDASFRTGGAAAGWGGAIGLGGASASPSMDAGASMDAIAVKGDGRSDATLSITLGTDAMVFSWDGLSPKTGGFATGSGGAIAQSGGKVSTGGVTTGSGGMASFGGAASSAGSIGMGGASYSGGTTSAIGGSIASGGSTASGGSMADAGVAYDAFAGMDGVSSIPDAGVDRDGNRVDGKSTCTTHIRGVVPMSMFHLIAGDGQKVVLRAEVTDGSSLGRKWKWWGYLGNSLLATTGFGTVDPTLASFPIAKDGRYTFRVSDETNECSASISVDVFPSDACPECNRVTMVQAAPPVASGLPIQNGPVRLLGDPPFVNTRIVLARGVGVRVAPSIGTDVKVSYVRILDAQGTTRADGVADQKSPFATRLLGMNSLGQILRYHVLAVPLDGQDGGTIGATAPQLFPNLSPDEINTTAFRLADGISVTGTVYGSTENPVADARVVLTNQKPDTLEDSPRLLFSSIGKSDAQGTYRLQVQPGSYWPAVTPPAGVGYAEAVALSSVTIAEGTQISFRWNAPGLTTVKLTIQDSKGITIERARVRLSTAKPREVGQFRVRSSTGSETTLGGYGNVTVEAVASSTGEVVFSNLPVDTEYSVLIVPEPLGPFSTTTMTTLAVLTGNVTKVLRTTAETTLKGQLLGPVGGSAPDWSRMAVWAYDKSVHDAEAPRSTMVRSDGSFSLGVTPQRPYVLIAIPPADGVFARTFVGPGVMQATEFEIVQRIATRMEWASQVMDETQSVLGGTAVQIFCEASWPLCVDATIPIAETTAGVDGSFRLGLPDPASR